MEIKDKIESILDNCNVNSFQYKDDGYAHEVTISDLASKIMDLLPRKRYPDKDGWPSINMELLMICTVDGKIIIEKFGMFDQKLKRKDIDWWIPVSEVLGVLQ